MKWRVQLVKKQKTITVQENQTKKITFQFAGFEHFDQELQLVAEKNAQLECAITIGSLDEQVASGNINLKIICVSQGSGAVINCSVTIVSKAGQNHTVKTEQIHTEPHSTSSVKVKAVVFKEGFHQYHGIIKLEQGSDYAQAWQENKILLVEQGARAISEPTLQIKHDAVKCGHGTAISQLDPDHIFYLQSRAISLDTGQYLLLSGFLL